MLTMKEKVLLTMDANKLGEIKFVFVIFLNNSLILKKLKELVLTTLIIFLNVLMEIVSLVI